MKEIGGYFELELKKGREYHSQALALNTGRNALEYILTTKKYKKVYIPYYTCDVILEPLKKLNIEYEFYSIRNNFEPVFEFSKVNINEVFVYTNYFGMCNHIVKKVCHQCENIIIDNSQSFYSKPLPNVDTFYSARKFFGVPDGAYLYTNKLLNVSLKSDISYHRLEHLLGRIDLGAEQFYNKYKSNDDALINQPIKRMSKITKSLLCSIDYKSISEKRIKNFNLLHSYLKNINQLKIDFELNNTAMIYPLLIDSGSELKKRLIENKIFVATYWPNVYEWVTKDSNEMYFYNNLLCIPIDQRYSIFDMKRIINVIQKNNV